MRLEEQKNEKKTAVTQYWWLYSKHIVRMFFKAFAVSTSSCQNPLWKIKPTWTYNIVLYELYVLRAHLRPGVHHIHEVAAGIGPQDGLQHLFILQAAGAETWQGLAAAADGSLGGGKRHSGFRQECLLVDFKWITALDDFQNNAKCDMWESGWIQTHRTFSSLACSISINQPHNIFFVHLVATGEQAWDRCVTLPSDSWTRAEPLCTIWAPHTGPSTLGSWPRTHKALPTVQSRINRTDHECYFSFRFRKWEWIMLWFHDRLDISSWDLLVPV